MLCPNCHKEMKNKCHNYYSLADWCVDYPASYHEEYSCKDCKIKYENGEWNLPIDMQPTEKQKKAVLYICNGSLDVEDNHCELVTKQQYWIFINKYMRRKQAYKKTDDDVEWSIF